MGPWSNAIQRSCNPALPAYYRDSRSDRHLRDIGMMLQLSADQIDQQEVERWVRELDLGAEWGEARNF